MSRLTHRAQLAATDAHAIDTRIGTWIANQQLKAADGYSPGRPTDHGPRAVNTINDPTLNAAITNTGGTGPTFGPQDRIDWARTQLAAITRDWTDLAGRQRALLDFMRPDPVDPAPLPPRCNGDHLPGAHIPISDGGWHDPTCGNDAELYTRTDGTRTLRRNGLCGSCSKRYTRWSGITLDTSGAAEVPTLPGERRNPPPDGQRHPRNRRRQMSGHSYDPNAATEHPGLGILLHAILNTPIRPGPPYTHVLVPPWLARRTIVIRDHRRHVPESPNTPTSEDA